MQQKVNRQKEQNVNCKLGEYMLPSMDYIFPRLLL